MNRLRRMGRHAEQQEEQAPEPEAEAPGDSQAGNGTEAEAEARAETPADTEGMPAVEAEPTPAGTTEPEPEAVPVAQDAAAAEAAPPSVEPEAIVPEAVAEPALVEHEASTPPPVEAAVLEATADAAPGVSDQDAAVAEAQPEQPVAPGASMAPPQGEEGKTAPLSPAEREELTALPANAVVSGKYVVQSQLHHGADRNLYRVNARRQQKCAVCGRLSSADASTCEHCGAALTGEAPADFYLMAESFLPQALMQDPTIMDLRLYHPNIVPVVDYFSYTPFGKARYYAVAEPRQGVRLSQLSLPRPGTQVFGWALQLADALDYLHSRGVVGAGAEADDILVQGDTASLASLQNARVASEESPERTQMQSLDLAKLAATIYEAYTGHPASMSPEGMLPMPSQTPENVGAALRAAIEPAQGIAPPISAAHWRDLISAALLAISELEQPGRPVAVTSATLTDVGQMRDQNQDSFSRVEFSLSSVEQPMQAGVYVVADGMGGHKGGEIASAIAAQTFAAEVMARVLAPLVAAAGARPALTNEAILQGMVRAAQSSNERIYKARDSRQNDMGTTLVSALVFGGKAYIVNIGDSRLYFYTRREQTTTAPAPPAVDATAPLKSTASLEDAMKDEARLGERHPEEFALTQVSVDHSLVHRLVELGQLDPEEAKVHPHRNFIYRSLGGPPPVDVDTFVRTLHPGDRILICSDGLNSMIDDPQIEQVLGEALDPQSACDELVRLANEAGGYDNITAIVVEVTDYLPYPEHNEALNNL